MSAASCSLQTACASEYYCHVILYYINIAFVQRFPWAAQIIAESALTTEEPKKLALLLTGQQVFLYGPDIPLQTRYSRPARTGPWAYDAHRRDFA